jgi:hypothetical protein
MGSSNSKVECLCLPGQSGKTRKVQHSIRNLSQSMLELEDGEDDLNIFICSNNRALVQQTSSRMEEDLYYTPDINEDEDEEKSDAKIEGRVFSWFSGNKETNISYKELAFEVLTDINMIICCSNSTRLKYLKNLIQALENFKAFTKKINIWIDEADSSINLWSKEEMDVTKFSKVRKVTLISATFDSIHKKYERIKILPFEVTHPDTYHKIEECEIIINDVKVKKAIEFLQDSFEKYKTQLCVPGIRLFAPGDIEIQSHNEVLDFLQTKGFCVAILNGKRKEIVLQNGKSIKLDEKIDFSKETPEEIGKKISNIYKDNRLYEYPFAITGQMCLGRGLTFQNDKFLFDYGIIPNMMNKANAYQCGCRMAGNIKGLSDYKISKLITLTKMKERMLSRERIAVNIAKIVYDNLLFDVGKKEFDIAKDPEENAKREVPILITTSEENIEAIINSDSEGKRDMVLDILDEVNPLMASLLRSYICRAVTEVKTEGSYNFSIVSSIKCIEENKKFAANFSVKDKSKNVWVAFIDNFSTHINIILNIYHGETGYNPHKPMFEL